MPTQDPNLQATRRIAAALLDVPGISAVGLRGDGVVIYLESDEPDLRRRASAVARTHAPDVALRFEISARLPT